MRDSKHITIMLIVYFGQYGDPRVPASFTFKPNLTRCNPFVAFDEVNEASGLNFMILLPASFLGVGICLNLEK